MSMSGSVGAATPKQQELKPLFEPLKLGQLELPNRILMAPLTRNRAHADGTPKEMAATYYSQRASAGLIISEATQISPMGKGYIDTPGIYEDRHVEGWKAVTDAVHEKGGRIICQLWHVGRISHTSLLPDGAQPHAPSAIAADAQTFTPNGFEPTSEPKAMTTDDIKRTVDDYAHAAKQALAAGFDGVEVHAANGYLLDQFIRDKSNKREDAYGGSVENRLRFLREVLDGVTAAIGADRTGIRLSPLGTFNDISDSDPETTFSEAVALLNPYGLAYCHFLERFGGDVPDTDLETLGRISSGFDGPYIANGNFDAEEAARWIAKERCDAVTFGKLFIANPDLPKRLALGAALNDWNQDTFYGGGEERYIDYPFLEEDIEEETPKG
ncbi:GTN reductase [Parvularcula bermudensis HTCC2503]|uniref:GTN reductase n=1 Tax=Parvularcula bermudensis (strain ATCC BAA-594 / HTCC2503 / KCTC 12087) TaxID=314260 RepID=E0TEA8_PARBH|nr:alkene reductase [Parvularcula bermudensis]ADM09483.1 GTN reductase [Parvularcula bermudensis HTCC2503]